MSTEREEYPPHLQRFYAGREKREAKKTRVANTLTMPESNRILAEAKLRRDQMIHDADMHAIEVRRELDAEIAKRRYEVALEEKRVAAMKATAVRKLESAKKRAKEIRGRAEAYRKEIIDDALAQKKEIILSGKACTNDIVLMYATVQSDVKKFAAAQRGKAISERKAIVVDAEREAKLIREKARNEGLALADLEIKDRATVEINAGQDRGRRRG